MLLISAETPTAVVRTYVSIPKLMSLHFLSLLFSRDSNCISIQLGAKCSCRLSEVDDAFMPFLTPINRIYAGVQIFHRQITNQDHSHFITDFFPSCCRSLYASFSDYSSVHWFKWMYLSDTMWLSLSISDDSNGDCLYVHNLISKLMWLFLLLGVVVVVAVSTVAA